MSGLTRVRNSVSFVKELIGDRCWIYPVRSGVGRRWRSTWLGGVQREGKPLECECVSRIFFLPLLPTQSSVGGQCSDWVSAVVGGFAQSEGIVGQQEPADMCAQRHCQVFGIATVTGCAVWDVLRYWLWFRLVLSGNRLASLPSTLTALTNLDYLDLGGNPDLPPQFDGSMTKVGVQSLLQDIGSYYGRREKCCTAVIALLCIQKHRRDELRQCGLLPELVGMVARALYTTRGDKRWE